MTPNLKRPSKSESINSNGEEQAPKGIAIGKKERV